MGLDLEHSKNTDNFSKTFAFSTDSLPTLRESNIEYKERNLSGVETLVGLDSCILSHKNIITGKDLKIKHSGEALIIRLHFSLKGNYTYKCFTNEEFVVNIPEGNFNLFATPFLNGVDHFIGKNINSLDIYLTNTDLKNNLGDNLTEQLINMYNTIDACEPFVFYNESKRIHLKIRNQVNEIINCSYTGKTKEIFLQSRLNVLLIDLLIEKSKSVSIKESLSQADYLAVIKVEQYCKNNLRKKLNITDLAMIAGYNTTKLKQNFKKVFKTTIFKHITHLRMEKARYLIQEEGYSVAEAAYNVGYSNPQHFTTAFKKKLGYLPSQILKQK